MDKKKTIVHIIPNFNFGGAEIYLLDVLKHINKEKYNIHIITIRPNIEWFKKELDIIEGLTVHTLNIKSLMNVKWALSLGKIIKRLKPDIVHSHLNLSVLVVGFLKKFIKAPIYVASQHSVYREKTFYYKVLKKAMLSNDVLLANSKFTENYLNEIKENKNTDIRTIVLGVDFKRYSFNYNRNAILKELGLPVEGKIVGNIGRYKHHKGHVYLIEMFQEVLKKEKNTHLLLVGSGALKQEIISLVKEKKIETNVKFVDETKNVSKYLTAFDLYCSTSVSESFGISVLEAIMFNIPIASFNTDAIPELVIDNKTGLLAEKLNTTDLAEKVIALLKDGEKRANIKMNQKSFVKDYTIQSHLLKLEKFYDNITFLK
ncbi:glycosyltransferase [uncultured Lacinutrix sp.]|uniref:glycosyltransferase n=1 Tax=uncultured Lacinutrix sp. TaxID=574032 RepID=UPI00261115D1|nr:glycosyltransferase [uncultured Lacinutrix sp.]